MAKFNLPSANSITSFIINDFGGVDLWSSPDNVSKNRSPDCVNMIRDKNGSLRKRMGYEKLISQPFENRINGACFFAGKHFVHSGTILYSLKENGEKTICAYNLADEKSLFFTAYETLYVLSGDSICFVDTLGSCGRISANAYVPTVIVSKSPAGGGTLHEAYNLISPRWKEQFLADGESTVYKLEKENVDLIINVSVRDENGDMQIVDPLSYTFSPKEGTITFSEPPPKPAVVGMDNVFVEAMKNDGNKEMIYGCKAAAVFGTNGVNDRLFLGGNPSYAGMDFYSAAGDFSYFPQMNYSKLSHGQIKGYSVFNGSLYTHLSSDVYKGENVIIKRNGVVTEDGTETFVITDEFSSPEFSSVNTSLSLGGEALFLSPKGIYGMTVSDVTDEKVCELRSAYLGKAFSEFSDEELKNSHAVIFDDFYMLALGGKMFVIDGAKKSYFSGTPLCSFQYECYYWDNIPSRSMWTDGKTLYFGDERGYIYRFFSDKSSKDSYRDDGKAVACHFDTADIDERIFFKKKTYVSVSAKIGAFNNTGVKIYAQTDGNFHERPIYDSLGKGNNFSFDGMDFEGVSFYGGRNEAVLCGKIRIRNINSIRFRLANDKAEPFCLYSFGAEYVQKGNRL